MRTFFGGTFIEKEQLEEAGIYHSVKLEYYKQINENDINTENNAKYGVVIVKTEYAKDELQIETKEIKYITNDEIEENKILNIFRENCVTPINSEEVICDLFRNRF